MNPQHEVSHEKVETKSRRNLGRLSRVGYLFIYVGVISLVSSILFNSSILAFIGLGLTLWGGLFLFAKPTKYVKLSVLESVTLSSLGTIDRVLRELNYKGQPVHLPPRHLEELHEGIVFVPTEQGIHLPISEAFVEGKLFLSPEGICLTPPGQALMDLYEKRLGTDFSRTNLNYLKNKLPDLLVEDLEILDDLEINEVADGLVVAKMKGEVHMSLCNQNASHSQICSRLGCPLCSSLACALARATDKAVIIERNDVNAKEKTTETWYRFIEEK